MTAAPVDADRGRLHRRIEYALAALRGARDCYDHCPSGENQLLVERAEAMLNGLLGHLPQARDEDR